MTILFRKSRRFGTRLAHVRMNASKSGVSWTVKVGPWSWNTRSRAHRVDLPGPFSWKSTPSKKKPNKPAA